MNPKHQSLNIAAIAASNKTTMTEASTDSYIENAFNFTEDHRNVS